MLLGIYTKMRKCHEIIIEKKPDDPTAKENYGVNLRKIGLYQKACEQYLEAVSLYNESFNEAEAKRIYEILNTISVEQKDQAILFE